MFAPVVHTADLIGLSIDVAGKSIDNGSTNNLRSGFSEYCKFNFGYFVATSRCFSSGWCN